uniref:Uncharacterized protein n=2 Tax=Trichogramma kaykai TaxID=54128 RepID=A0ABD2W730_9HYME
MYTGNSPLMAVAQSSVASAGLLNMEALCQNKNPLVKTSMLSWLSGRNNNKTAPNLPTEKKTSPGVSWKRRGRERRRTCSCRPPRICDR